MGKYVEHNRCTTQKNERCDQKLEFKGKLNREKHFESFIF